MSTEIAIPEMAQRVGLTCSVEHAISSSHQKCASPSTAPISTPKSTTACSTDVASATPGWQSTMMSTVCSTTTLNAHLDHQRLSPRTPLITETTTHQIPSRPQPRVRKLATCINLFQRLTSARILARYFCQQQQQVLSGLYNRCNGR